MPTLLHARIVCQGSRRVLRDAHLMTGLAEAAIDPLPPRTVNKPAVYKDHRLHWIPFRSLGEAQHYRRRAKVRPARLMTAVALAAREVAAPRDASASARPCKSILLR